MRTPEQQKYIEEVLGIKSRIKSKKANDKVRSGKWREKPHAAPVELTATDYMYNCVYWIDEFIAGRVEYVRLRAALLSLEVHIKVVRDKYLPNG